MGNPRSGIFALQRSSFTLAAALLLLGIGGCDGVRDSGAGGEACEVSGAGIKATCYQDWEYCGSSTAHTAHPGKRCKDVGYPLECCSEGIDSYYRPAGANCDANHHPCGYEPPVKSRCERCLDMCRGDPLCCTGRGCYCESECS